MRKRNTTKKINYIENLYAKDDLLLNIINENIVKLNRQIHITPLEGKIIELLLKSIKAVNIVEIGTLAGYSTIWLARAVTGIVHTIEQDQKFAIIAQQHFDLFSEKNKIILHTGNASEILINLNGPFDAVFIDADKKNYPHYLNWAEKNIRIGGLIIADNTLLSGGVYGGETNYSKTAVTAMHEFNVRLSDDKKFCGIILPTDEGLTVAIKL